MNTPVPTLDRAFEPPPGRTGVTLSEVMLTPAEADRVIATMGFEWQRDMDWVHARMLADMMANGEFAAGSQLTFAFDEEGAPKLVDGQHRLRAAVNADWTSTWNVRVVWDGQVQDAQGLYVLLDGYQKKRSPAVMGRALGLEALHVRMQGVAMATARYQNLWSSDYVQPDGCAQPPIRDNVARVRERMAAFIEADEILNLSRTSSQAKRKLTTGQVLAVIVETLATDKDGEAKEFWTSVATSGDGIAGKLREDLIAGKPSRTGALYVPRLVAMAWNQRGAEKIRRAPSGKSLAVKGTALVIPA